MDDIRIYYTIAFLIGAVIVVIYRRWIEHERARFDEIRRRERLRRILGPRK